MTLIEMFNKMRTHLLTQNEKSQLPGSMVCAYRGEFGRMCAIGCLIPDYKYNPKLESLTVNDTSVSDAIPGFYLLDAAGRQTLRDAQQIHDYYPVSQWKERLDAIASRIGA